MYYYDNIRNYSEVRPFHCHTLDIRHNYGEKECFWPQSTEFIWRL